MCWPILAVLAYVGLFTPGSFEICEDGDGGTLA
jgi:hypothetical protein